MRPSLKTTTLNIEAPSSVQNINIRRFRKEDHPLLFDSLKNGELLSVLEPLTLRFNDKYQSFYEKQKNQKQILPFTIACQQQAIGTSAFINIDWENRHARLICSVYKPAVSNIKIANLLCWFTQYGFSELNLHRIYGFVDSTNHGLIQQCEKIGMVQEGILRECLYKKGIRRDLIIFASILQRKQTTLKQQ